MKKPIGQFLMIFAAVAMLLTACDLFNNPGNQIGLTTLAVNATLPGAVPLARPAPGSRAVTSIELTVDYPAGTAVGIISLTTVRFVLKEFELEQEGDVDAEFEFEGPYLVDLLAETMTPEPVAVDLPPGTYSQVKFKIDRIEGDEEETVGTPLVAADDPLFGHSMYLAGTYTPTGGEAVGFTYTFDVDAEFELTPAADTSIGFDIMDTVVNDVMIAFRLGRWFDGIDPAAFAAAPGDYAEELKENIKGSADYGKDEDHDGVLESSEDDDPDIEDDDD